VKWDSRSASLEADEIEENGNQTDDVICTYCKGRYSDDLSDMGTMHHVQEMVP
jgi:uncharacterized protein YcgI (DUF1989 family)